VVWFSESCEIQDFVYSLSVKYVPVACILLHLGCQSSAHSHTHTPTHTHVHIHTHTHMHTHTHTPTVHTPTHTCTHTPTHTLHPLAHPLTLSTHSHTHPHTPAHPQTFIIHDHHCIFPQHLQQGCALHWDGWNQMLMTVKLLTSGMPGHR